MNSSGFSRILHTVLRETGGSLVNLQAPDVTPNFLVATLRYGRATCYLLQSVDGYWACASTWIPDRMQLVFADHSRLARALCHQRINLLSKAVLDGPLQNAAAYPHLSAADLKYWKPKTLGEALFNWWD